MYQTARSIMQNLPSVSGYKPLVLSTMLTVALISTEARAAAIAAPAKSAAQTTKAASKGDWKSLTAAQRIALAPLQTDWHRLDDFRREKWIELANRFTTMPPADQARMQERMREWVQLSPEQRQLARENYKRVQKLKVEKNRQWEQYQQLPEEKKKELATTTVPKKPLANPPRHVVQKPAVPSNTPINVVPSPLPATTPAPASDITVQNEAEIPPSSATPVQSSPSTP